MRFIQEKNGSCDIIFSDEEIKVLNKYKKLQLPKESTKHFINNLSRLLLSLNGNFDEETKKLLSSSTVVEIDKPED